jgi:hypothetical protein
MFSAKDTLAKVDPELWQAIEAENKRQEDHIELIASENYVSKAVMEAQGSQLTNKYAEGYPGKRYTPAAASTSTSPSRSPSTASRRCSAPMPPTSSRTPVRRPTRPC